VSREGLLPVGRPGDNLCRIDLGIEILIELSKFEDWIEEGAASLLLEPALFTMDLLAMIRPLFAGPLVPFSVSGEYRMLTNATDDPAESARIMLEYLGTLKRAGADSVITYAAKTLSPLCPV